MNYQNWEWKATKLNMSGEYSENLTYDKISEMLLSGNFMVMLRRMQIGDELFYNERNIKFQRIK